MGSQQRARITADPEQSARQGPPQQVQARAPPPCQQPVCLAQHTHHMPVLVVCDARHTMSALRGATPGCTSVPCCTASTGKMQVHCLAGAGVHIRPPSSAAAATWAASPPDKTAGQRQQPQPVAASCTCGMATAHHTHAHARLHAHAHRHMLCTGHGHCAAPGWRKARPGRSCAPATTHLIAAGCSLACS
jgi:hypothetical protein